jgi:hypothetical protein
MTRPSLSTNQPVALAPVLEVHRLEACGVAAGQVEVGLGCGVREAVEAAVAEAVLITAELVRKDGLDLALELVGGRQDRLSRPGARGGAAGGTGGTHYHS